MRNMTRMAALALAALAAVLMAAAGARAGELRVGFVNLQAALNQCEAGKASKRELEGFFRKRQAEIETRVEERNALKEELDNQSTILNETVLREKTSRLDRLEKEIDRMVGDSQEELQKMQREREVGILKDLDELIQKIGKEKGLTLILPSEVIIYADDILDLTDTVILRYNEMWQARQGAAPAGAENTPARPAAPTAQQPRKGQHK